MAKPRETVKSNVFLSWSGERSLYVAKFFHTWLPSVLPHAKPWLSDIDIEKGTVGLDEIKKALAGKKVDRRPRTDGTFPSDMPELCRL